MRVFISSIIRGFSEYRQAARTAVELLEFRPIMAEDFGARPESAEKACLDEVANSDVVVLILGARYSGDPSIDPSVTEQEYDEAVRLRKPVLAFVVNGTTDPRQAEFIKKVEDLKDGVTRGRVRAAEELKDAVVGALTKLNRKAAPPRSADDASRLLRPILEELGGKAMATTVVLAAVPVPAHASLASKVIADPRFPESIARSLMSGPPGYFDLQTGYEHGLLADGIIVHQQRGYESMGAYAFVGRDGTVVLGRTLRDSKSHSGPRDMEDLFLIDEAQVREYLATLAGFAAQTFGSVYEYNGPLYVQAGILRMEYRKFGHQSPSPSSSATMYSGMGADPAYVPPFPEVWDMSTDKKNGDALASEFVEQFRWMFKKDGRLIE